MSLSLAAVVKYHGRGLASCGLRGDPIERIYWAEIEPKVKTHHGLEGPPHNSGLQLTGSNSTPPSSRS